MPVGQAVSSRGPDARLVEPAGLAVDAFGRRFVSDAALHRLEIFDARGAWLATAGTLGSDPGQLRRPGAVTALGQAGIAVLDRENFRVESYDLLGRRLNLGHVEGSGRIAGQLFENRIDARHD